jgi:hypothetical protein
MHAEDCSTVQLACRHLSPRIGFGPGLSVRDRGVGIPPIKLALWTNSLPARTLQEAQFLSRQH